MTNGINLPRIRDFTSPVEFLGAPIHGGWSVDVRNQTAKVIDSLPPGGIGISSFTVGNQLLIPRASGEIDGSGNITSATTQVYGYDGTTATALFTLGGFLNNVVEF